MSMIIQPLHRSIVLCSGGGGADIGIERAGFKVELAIDMDKSATACYHANFENTPVLTKKIEDVSVEEILKLTGLKVGELDHLHCSWPCVEYSSANTRTAKNPPENINRVFNAFVEKIKGLQPKTWTGENVDGILFGEKKAFFKDAINSVVALGNYDFKYKVLNSAFYKVPQNRRRLIMIAKRKDVSPGIPLEFPKPEISIEGLRVKDVFPQIKFYRQNQFAKTIIHNTHLMCTITATDGLMVYDHAWRKISIEEIKTIMGFPKEFKLPSKSRITNVRILGNAVPPPLMTAVMERIKNILIF